MPSAKRQDLATLKHDGRLLMRRRKSKGPKIDPRGTPFLIRALGEEIFLDREIYTST